MKQTKSLLNYLKPKTVVVLIIFLATVFATNLASSNSTEVTVIPMQQKGAHTFYIEAKLSGLGKSEFMVDTGSGYSTINEKTLASLKASGTAIYVKDLLGILADGSEKRVPVYRLAALTLSDNCKIQDVEVAIFPGATRHILGLNTLRKMGSFEFSFAPPQLVLRDCGNA